MSIQVCKGLEADQDPLESWHLCQKFYFTFHLSVLDNEMLFVKPKGLPGVQSAVTWLWLKPERGLSLQKFQTTQPVSTLH